MAGESGLGRRLAGIAFIVAALAAAVFVFFKYGKPAMSNAGGSDEDAIWLQCGKCGAEFSISSEEFARMPFDPNNTSIKKCIKCGELQARMASMRCPHCNRLVPQQTPGTAYVCPHCKKPLAPGAAP